jgi:hypothetical protein
MDMIGVEVEDLAADAYIRHGVQHAYLPEEAIARRTEAFRRTGQVFVIYSLPHGLADGFGMVF